MSAIPAPKSTYLTTLVASTLLFGSSFPATKILLNDLSPLMLVAERFLCAAASLIPVLIWYARRQRSETLGRRPWGKLVLIALLQTTGAMGLLNIGLQYTSPGHASIIMASNPMIVAALLLVGFRQRLPAINYLGLLIAFAGVASCILAKGTAHHASLQGDLIVALGALSWAIATLCLKRFELSLSTWEITFWQMLIGSALIFVIALLRGERPALPTTPGHGLVFLWLAVPATTGAMVLWFRALAQGGAVLTSSFLFLSPFFSLCISYLLLNDSITGAELLGGAAIGVGLYLTTHSHHRLGY